MGDFPNFVTQQLNVSGQGVSFLGILTPLLSRTLDNRRYNGLHNIVERTNAA